MKASTGVIARYTVVDRHRLRQILTTRDTGPLPSLANKLQM
jgi:hypothetical protein